MFRLRHICCLGLLILTLCASSIRADRAEINSRRPPNESELEYWLKNMVWDHNFSNLEIQTATGMTADEIEAALERLDIRRDNTPKYDPDAPLRVVPYPGGRHPRIGFLEGAVNPQRETKISVFTPWSPDDYVVVDVPEAIFSNLGLLYLAHEHVPTVWTEQGMQLTAQEWTRQIHGSFESTRMLPNGVRFRTKIVPHNRSVRMQISLTNGTKKPLNGLRIQNCVLLKGAKGFDRQVKDNKRSRGVYIAAPNEEENRWIITAWEPTQRVWANDKCPCIHSDPQLANCPPGTTQHAFGWLSFYEGEDVEAEFDRIDKIGWRDSLGE